MADRVLNLNPNGSVDNNVTGWVNRSGGTTLHQAGVAYRGAGSAIVYSQAATLNSGGNAPISAAGSAGQGRTFTVQARIRAGAGVQGRLVLSEVSLAGGTLIEGFSVFVGTGAWEPVTHTRTLTHVNANRIKACIVSNNATDPANIYEVDDVGYQEEATAGPYYDSNGVEPWLRDAAAVLPASAALVAFLQLRHGAEAVLAAAAAVAAAAQLTYRGAAELAAAGGMAPAGYTRIDQRAQALEYRRQQQAREDHRLHQELALAGSAAAVTRQEANWDALRPWDGWNPVRRVKGEPE